MYAIRSYYGVEAIAQHVLPAEAAGSTAPDYHPRRYTPPTMALQFKQATLPNGLTVAGEIIDDAHTAAVGFFVRTGARDERTEVMA